MYQIIVKGPEGRFLRFIGMSEEEINREINKKLNARYGELYNSLLRDQARYGFRSLVLGGELAILKDLLDDSETLHVFAMLDII